MTSTPAQKIRFTISVDPEVHEVFTRLSTAAGWSLSKTIGEWLSDSADAAVYTANMLSHAREAPKEAIRKINAVTASLVAENEALSEQLRKRIPVADAVRAERSEHAPQERSGLHPPSCNTGGKGTPNNKQNVGTRKAAR